MLAHRCVTWVQDASADQRSRYDVRLRPSARPALVWLQAMASAIRYHSDVTGC